MSILKLLKVSGIANFALLVMVAGSFSSCKGGDSPSPESKATESAVVATSENGTASEANRKLIVYYFHTTGRCYSCNMIENLTQKAIQAGYSDQIKNSRVEFKSINIDLPENEHFTTDYKLYTKSVILSDIKDGKETNWKNLDQVWMLLRNETNFVNYIQKEMKAFL